MILTGAIGFTTDTSLLSRAIRWFTKSQFSHTFIVITDDSLGVQLAIEADSYGVAIVPLTKYKTCELFEINNPDESALKEIVTKYSEKSYGWFQIASLAVILFLRRFGLKIKTNPIRGGIICSELVALYLMKLNLAHLSQDDLNLATPESIWQILQSISKKNPALGVFKRIQQV